MASQWRMMWWKLKRHRLAVVSASILLAMYASILIAEFLAPYSLHTRHTDFIFAPPQAIHLFHEGSFVGPFVYGLDYQLDLDTLKRELHGRHEPRPADPLLLPRRRLRFLGPDPGRLPPRSARRRTARCSCSAPTGSGATCSRGIIYGARISLTIGLIGVTLSFVLGIVHRRLAGYYGGWVDNVIQRVIEILRSFPELPLWMALSAALPVTWSPLLIYFGITIILGLIDWTGLARAVRSKLLALREEDFCTAADADGRHAAPHHRPPPAAELHEPPDRLGDAVDPVDDPGRDGALLPRPRPAAADHVAGACC